MRFHAVGTNVIQVPPLTVSASSEMHASNSVRLEIWTLGIDARLPGVKEAISVAFPVSGRRAGQAGCPPPDRTWNPFHLHTNMGCLDGAHDVTGVLWERSPELSLRRHAELAA